MMSEEIKPCPFCGGTDIRFTNHGRISTNPLHRYDDVWSMACYDCEATFPNRYLKEKLVECWNRRADDGLQTFLLEDNRQLRNAGCKLAEAAIRVARESDGTHRLMLAVSEWTTAIANEGGRGKR